MAGFVSVSFSVPLTILKEMQPRKLDKVILSNRAITRTASKLVPSCGSHKAVFMNWRNHHHLRVFGRQFVQIKRCIEKRI